MPKYLTVNQEKVYTFICGYISQEGCSPYLREIQKACNVQSHKVVIDRLNALERKGYIKRKINQHRGIKLCKNNQHNHQQPSNIINHEMGGQGELEK